jgi:hypothetical protein
MRAEFEREVEAARREFEQEVEAVRRELGKKGGGHSISRATWPS